MKHRFVRLLLAVFTLVALSGCGYNQMQANEEEVFAAWGNLEASLQRRGDLIPNLVATVKGYAAHEKETLTGVIEARAKATSITLSPEMLSDPAAMKKFNAAQGELSSWLSKLMMVREQYPNLKADAQFTNLMHQLEGTENRINVARQRYN
jgi:LemA protein